MGIFRRAPNLPRLVFSCVGMAFVGQSEGGVFLQILGGELVLFRGVLYALQPGRSVLEMPLAGGGVHRYFFSSLPSRCSTLATLLSSLPLGPLR